MAAPLIEFDQFAYPHRWWLRREPPPWLNDRRWYANAFRCFVFFGVLASASGVCSLGVMSLPAPPTQILSRQSWELLWIASAGIVFGILTLIPLSRWLGRGWIMSLLAVPVSALACFCGLMTILMITPLFGESRVAKMLPGGKDAVGFYAGFVGSAIVSIWMGHPGKRLALCAGLLATGMVTLLFGCFFWFSFDRSLFPSLPSGLEWIPEIIPFQVFQCSMAISLSARLWWIDHGELSATDPSQ